MTCRYCGFDLNDGDIYEVLKSKPDYQKKSNEEVMKIAGYYGWTPENKKFFSKEMTIEFECKGQITICPDCKGISPTNLDAPKKYMTEN
jgi:hypothetical protein